MYSHVDMLCGTCEHTAGLMVSVLCYVLHTSNTGDTSMASSAGKGEIRTARQQTSPRRTNVRTLWYGGCILLCAHAPDLDDLQQCLLRNSPHVGCHSLLVDELLLVDEHTDTLRTQYVRRGRGLPCFLGAFHQRVYGGVYV